MCGSDIFLGLIAIIFPPIAVWVKRGICSCDSLINILLCALGFLPGLIHAWYIIAITPDPTYEALLADAERGQGGHVTYYYVQQSGPQYQAPAQRGYGATDSTPQSQFPTSQDQGFVQPAAPKASGSKQTDVPPTYDQAVQGDHKVQHP